ncbi:MAG: hypothetical protein MUC87_10420 [Bacteroidia bacterium]|jgi:hypothetical protein|nr:hypothetical protein [Bacteroidia bacterium]
MISLLFLSTQPKLTFSHGARVVFNFLSAEEQRLLYEKLPQLLVNYRKPENKDRIRKINIPGKPVYVLSINDLRIFFQAVTPGSFDILDITDRQMLERFSKKTA